MKKLALSIFLIGLLTACQPGIDPNEPAGGALYVELPGIPPQPYNYARPQLPPHFMRQEVDRADNEPRHNEVTDWGATLGRVLFYDKKLSRNESISCASCHQQSAGFSDPRQFSLGFEGGETGRNSMGLANARYYENGHFFWDERAETLEDQVLGPIQDGVEMGMTLEEVVARVELEDHYQDLFTRAFGDPAVSSDRISLALAQFVRSMVSYESKYDQGLVLSGNPERDFPNFSARENLGKRLFFDREGGNCASCHATDVQITREAQNIGLDLVTVDAGLGNVTQNPNDEGKFKVPSLRNVAETGPYMHDGRFASLNQVIGFYNAGVQPHPNLDRRLAGNGMGPRRLMLNQEEMDALVAFLGTLSDEEFLTDPKFSDPF